MTCVYKEHQIKSAGAMTAAKNKVFTGLYNMKIIIQLRGWGN